MAVIVIIPARYGSTRLPAKLLKDVAGKPLIQHVYERACQAQTDRVVVATDHAAIVESLESYGSNVILTSDQHRSGTERIAEAINLLGLASDDIVVNVQGDEPMMHPELISQVASNLQKYPKFKMATLCEPFTDIQDVQDPNKVKVIFNANGCAQYFSRAVIPWARDAFKESIDCFPEGVNYYRHLGIYAYRADFVDRYINWPSSPWEEIEALEQLRVLWYGEEIHVAEAKHKTGPGIDTREDLEKLRRMWKYA